MSERHRRSRLVRWVFGGCILALAGLFAYAQVRGWTPGKVEHAVNRDLPAGSGRQQVEGYLDTKGWSHSYSDDTATLSYYGGAVGLNPDQLGGVVFAEVPDPNVGIGGLDKGTITVFFFLNHDDRLVRSHIRVSILSF